MRKPTTQGRSIFSRFAVPYTFNPDLSMGEAMARIVLTLARIFSACLLFAVWGGFSAAACSTIQNRYWRLLAALCLLLLFLAALAALMAAISALERKILPSKR